MAEAKISEIVHGENGEPEVFHDIDCHDLNPPESNALALLMKFTQPEDKPLPVGVITEQSIYALIKQVMGTVPFGVTVMNDRDVIVEFRPKVRLWEVSSLMYNLRSWDKYKIEVACLMLMKSQLTVMVKDRESARQVVIDYERKKSELIRETDENTEALRRKSEQIDAEDRENKIKIQDLLDKFEDQVRRIESISSHTSLPQPLKVPTPTTLQVPVADKNHVFYKTPDLPTFSGAIPVPKGEGSYEQFSFQIRGFRGNYTDEAIKSSMIGSVTDDVRDDLDFVGFQNSLNILIDTLERRYGKGQTTDKIQQQFYQLSQERGKQYKNSQEGSKQNTKS